MKYKACNQNQKGYYFLNICLFLIISQLIFVNSIFASSQSSAKGKQEIKDAIVKIYTVASEPSYFSPWKIGDPESSTGSGCVISGERILTNAHVISNQKYMQVQPYGQSKRYNAHVLYVSHEADLALLGVEDKSFFSDINPLQIGILPETLEEVLVYGYPTGGEFLSITKGILSRIEFQEYTHSGLSFLAGQIDAAINPGNSGGPVVDEETGKVVGMVTLIVSSVGGYGLNACLPSHYIREFCSRTIK